MNTNPTMNRRMLLTSTAALAATTLLMHVAAAADPTVPNPGRTPNPTVTLGGDNKYLGIAWDGTSDYIHETTESFHGLPLMAPGDTGTRTLTARNEGPTVGVLRVSIVGVNHFGTATKSPDVSATAVSQVAHDENPDMYAAPGDTGDFFTDVYLSSNQGSNTWTLRELINNQDVAGYTVILERSIQPGETVDIDLTYTWSAASIAGNQANIGSQLFEYAVLLEIGGELPKQPPVLAKTGINPTLAVTGVGAALLGGGGLLLLSSLRREHKATQERLQAQADAREKATLEHDDTAGADVRGTVKTRKKD